MAVFLIDVFAHGTAQPFQARGQTRATGHHQRHRMADMVVGLGQEGDVAVQADLAGQRVPDYRHCEQRLTLLGSLCLQSIEK